MRGRGTRRALSGLSLGSLGIAAGLALAACSSSAQGSSTTQGSGNTGQGAAATGSSGSAKPGTEFSTADVAGMGTVVVDAQGRTVYVLTADGKSNVPCTEATGCTKAWPDLPLPGGVTAAKAGHGVDAALLGTMKQSDGQTYPTYHGWLLYEFAGDSGPGQAKGQGIQSFGGHWWVLDASGNPVTTSPAGTSSGSTGPSSGGSGGYGGY